LAPGHLQKTRAEAHSFCGTHITEPALDGSCYNKARLDIILNTRTYAHAQQLGALSKQRASFHLCMQLRGWSGTVTDGDVLNSFEVGPNPLAATHGALLLKALEQVKIETDVSTCPLVLLKCHSVA
jgi:hypothetical protein